MDPAPVPIGFAHRGARAELPDNTLPAFARALELGAAGLESDVWVTADGVAVLDHDGTVGRWGRRRRIADTPRAQLPGHIPELAELYRACGTGWWLSLDVKDERAAAAAVAVAEAAGAVSRLWLCGPAASLGRWRSLSSAVRLVDSTGIDRIPEGLPARAAALAGAGAQAINLRWPQWDPTRIEAVHAAGLAAFAWDAQDRAVVARLVSMGIDAVYSDHVAAMLAGIADGRRPGP